jgi:hypothetical protein
LSFVLVAAVLAVTAVSVAERIEVELTDAPVAAVPGSPDPVVAPSNAVESDVLPASDAPLTSAVLPSGTMALTLRNGAATITTGVDSPAIELATATIGDLDLGERADDVVIAQADGEVSYDWGDVTEWYRTVPEGIEHGYTIDEPVSAEDDLAVVVDVVDGEPTLVDDQTVAIQRTGAGIVWYRGLFAFDADGTDLPAEMAVADGAIELSVDTDGAQYPITIDPVISDAQLIRVVAGEPTLDISQVADSGRLGTGGGGERIAPCLAGSLLIGLSVYQTSRDGNWLRSAVPQCRQVELLEGEVALTGDVLTGPEFGNRFGPADRIPPLEPPLETPVTGICEDGSAVTGLSGNAGFLVDNVVLACNTVNADGSVGPSTASTGPLGGSGGSSAAPVECTASFANGLQGNTGDDVDAIGLQCAQVSVTSADLAGDEFGWAVDIDGDRMVASAPFAEFGGLDRAGKVYVYTRGGNGAWALVDVITSPIPEAGGAFGDSLALNGNRLAVGESDRVSGLQESGRVWAFERGDSGWLQLGSPISVDEPAPVPLVNLQLTFETLCRQAGNESTWLATWRIRNGNDFPVRYRVRNDQGAFGEGVAPVGNSQFTAPWASGTTVITTLNPDGSPAALAENTKARGTFNPDCDAADATPPIALPNVALVASDAFGASLAWLGNSLVVGAPEAASGAGAVYITAVAEGTWSAPAALQTTPGSAPTSAAGDALGYSVDATASAAGSFVVAGAPGDDNATGNNAGAVHIWREIESGFEPAEKVTSGDDWVAADAVGSAVAVDGNVIVAAGLDGSGTGDPMTVRTVEIPLTGPATSTWSFRENLVVGVNQDPNDYVDINDGTIAVRRPGAGSEVLVFQDAGTGFPASPTEQFVASGRSFGDRIGFALELDGLTAIAGAPGDDDPNDAGSVYSFQIPEPVPPTVPPSGLSLDITSSTASTEVGVDAIDISSLPASVFQGYGGPTADYARADLQTIDLRSDTAESTPVADVTLADLALDTAPVTRGLLSTILLSDIPRNGGWSALLRPNGPLLVEQTITLLDVYRDYPAVLDQVRLGDLGLQASTLGSISTYAALLAGVPVDQLPVPGSATATDFWCGLVTEAGLDCEDDFGAAPLTLPVLSFAGVDVEQAEFLGALIDSNTDLTGTPIGSTLLGDLNIGDVPLASQPLVPSKSLPSYLPSTVDVPGAFLGVTLGELGQAAPLGALSPEDVGLESSDNISVLDLEFQPDSPLADYSWVAPAAGASLLVTNEAPLDPDVAAIPVGALGLNAPVLSVPLDEIILPNGRALADYRLVELLGGEAEFGAAPFAASPFAASPFGAAPFAASSIGASPFRASPFRASPFRASPFRASPFAASPFRASDIGSTPFRASPFRASPFRASPFAASTFGVSPFRASPFRASPFAASPFRASEFGVSPFGASPFRASPFRASSLDSSPFRASPFRASPLSELGLSAPVTAIPLGGAVVGKSLGSYLLSELDRSNLLFGLPLEPFVGWVDADDNPVFDCDVIDCRQPNGFTLGEGLDAGALPADLTLADVQPGLFGLRLADLVGANPSFTEEALRAFSGALVDVDGTPLTLGDAADAGFAPDGIPVELFSAYDEATIADERLLFSGWRLVDFAGLATGLDLDDLEAAVANWAATSTLQVGDLTGKIPLAKADGTPKDGLFDGELWVDTLAVSTLVDAAPGLTVGDVWPLLRPLRVEHLRSATDEPFSIVSSAASTTLGSVLVGDDPYPTASRLEGLLWGDIVGSAGTEPAPGAELFTVDSVIGAFTGVTLGEFLRAAQPITDQRTEEIDLSAIDLADYATGATVQFDVDITVEGGNRPQSTRIVVTLPEGSRYVPDSAAIAGFDLDENELAELEPTTFGDTLVWQIANLLPDTPYTLQFETRSSERVGTVVTAATAQLASVDLFAFDSAAVEYREALEPNNTPSQADVQPQIETDQIVLSQISSATDVDIFAFDVTTPGQRVGGVLWNLPADYDLTIIGPGTTPLSATSGRTRESVGDTDSSILGGATSSTLSDAGQYQPPSGLSVISRSTSRGTASENLAPVPTFVPGRYYLVVSPYDGAFGDVPYALRLLSDAPVVAPPVCSTVTVFPNPGGSAPALAPLPSDIDTLFVINHDRMARQYGDTEADRVVAEIQALNGALDGDLAGLQLSAGVLDLGSQAQLGSAYSAWDARPCEIGLANSVVRETIDVLGDVYDANPGIENVVLVGSDRIIPFARIADRTLIGNEQSYASTFAGDTSSPLYAALQAGTFFSDDPFVDTSPTLVNDRALYVAEKAVGRLVETPAEIIGQLQSFADRDGTIRVDSATVAGYDFLADSSEEIADRLGPDGRFVGPVQVPVDDDLIREDWTAPELAAKFFPQNASTPGIGVINGHFSHQGTQSALGSATSNEDDALFVGDIGTTDFTGSLLFTVGCHSGLTADEFIPGALGASWAESLAGAGASAYIAQSGFGYGSTDSIQLTERLLSTFASRLDGNYTIGEALTLAKNEYLAPLSAISVYDEKSLQQAILYGLPFSTPDVANPPAPPSAPDRLVLTDTDITGLRTASLNPEFEIDRVERDRGTVFEIDGESYAPSGQPLQPIISVDATGPDSDDDRTPEDRLHGALLLGGVAYTVDRSPIDPVYNTPTINRGAVEPEIQPIDAVFPISPLGVSEADTEFGLREYVAIQPGRFTATEPDGSGDQVLYENLSIQTLHSQSDDDWTAPTVSSVNQTVSAGALSVTVATPDDDVAGVVVAVVENLASATAESPALWRSFNLTPSNDGRWSGGTNLLDSCTETLEYLVQIFDDAGNVRVMSNKASGFVSSCKGEAPPPQDTALQAVPRPANLDAGSDWYVGPVSVDITSTLPGPFSYRLDGGAPTVLESGVTSFEITGDGIRSFIVQSAGSSLQAAGTVKIDTGNAAPSVAITSPTGDVIAGSPFTVAFSCQDPSLLSCEGTLSTDSGGDPISVISGQRITAVSGEYTLSVVADDAVSTTGPSVPVTRVFTASAVAPTITSLIGPVTPEQIGTQSTITVEFEDPELSLDEYTVEFDWGTDLTGEAVAASCVATSAVSGATAESTCSLTEPTTGVPGVATGTVGYAKPGVYSVDVTITDRSGLSSTETYEFVVVFDPRGGRVSGSGTFWSDPRSYFGDGPRWGTISLFGYDARYRNNSTAPVGQTRLRLLGGFDFRSTAYDYLVVNDTIAVTEGVGRIDGRGGYRMRVQGIDNGRVDFFQITIWDDETGEVVYDNGTVYEGVPDDVRTDAGDRVLLGGIVVRR